MRRSAANRLVLIGGQEGAGKTSLIKALGKVTLGSAAVDAEGVGQVNLCLYDDAFFVLLRRNIAWLVDRYWQAGYSTVITGSLFWSYTDYRYFKIALTTAHEPYVVNLLVASEVRQQRHLTPRAT